MNEFLEYLYGILAVSGCCWVLYALYNSIRIQKFIIKRNEEETDLLNTVFFREHATFTRYLPPLMSSPMYTSHLSMCLWGWRIYKGRKMFRDLEDPTLVTRHFSSKEIRRVRWFALNVFILFFTGSLILFSGPSGPRCSVDPLWPPADFF